ncbi:MAG: NADH-quinone oxidoreductase subunit A [Candidatus Krumholzibacteriia bacterium]|nr:NADH-quinone oxidoreductase subunit A [bacterium]MCB9516003.1 NADH-quinone oxidoreductase subunit A [Candidatus Latescibacterota bacterium]
MLFQFANVLVFILFSFFFIFALLAISKLLAPRHRDQDKLSPYECGERPSGSGRLQFNIRFYIIALAFLVFDVEIAFMFPVGKVMRSFVDSGQGWFVLVEVLLFILILFLGLVYLWRKGDLDWVKDLQVSRTDAPIELRRQSQSRPE